jgi:hypothetical protein
MRDAEDESAGHTNLHTFCDKWHSLYHRSPKNQVEIMTCVQSTHCQLLKTGRVFSVRRVVSSYRTVKSILQSYKALWGHFHKTSADGSRYSAERAKHERLNKTLKSATFVANLGSTVGHFVGIIRTCA